MVKQSLTGAHLSSQIRNMQASSRLSSSVFSAVAISGTPAVDGYYSTTSAAGVFVDMFRCSGFLTNTRITGQFDVKRMSATGTVLTARLKLTVDGIDYVLWTPQYNVVSPGPEAVSVDFDIDILSVLNLQTFKTQVNKPCEINLGIRRDAGGTDIGTRFVHTPRLMAEV